MKLANNVTVRACTHLKSGAGALALALALVSMALLPSPVWGQWTGGPTGPVSYNGGNVGIGTGAPGAKLHLSGGSFAIGGDLTGNAALAANAGRSIQLNTNAAYMTGTFDDHTGTLLVSTMPGGWGASRLEVRHSTLWGVYATAPDMVIGSNVGIGTTLPQYKLAVNGTIGAKEVIVTNTGWADYVFRPGYRLRPLSEVSAYIQAHQHLPDIPSEAEVTEKGVSVGEMQSKLLAKVEELTLHMIEQEKENRALRNRVAELEIRAERPSAAR